MEQSYTKERQWSDLRRPSGLLKQVEHMVEVLMKFEPSLQLRTFVRQRHLVLRKSLPKWYRVLESLYQLNSEEMIDSLGIN